MGCLPHYTCSHNTLLCEDAALGAFRALGAVLSALGRRVSTRPRKKSPPTEIGLMIVLTSKVLHWPVSRHSGRSLIVKRAIEAS